MSDIQIQYESDTMSNSIQKTRYKMHSAKRALGTLALYASHIDDPAQLAGLLDMLVEEVYRHAHPKDPRALKAVYALSSLESVLERRETKVMYSTSVQTEKAKRDELVLRYRKQGLSYQAISDRLSQRGIRLSKAGVYKIVQRHKGVS